MRVCSVVRSIHKGCVYLAEKNTQKGKMISGSQHKPAVYYGDIPGPRSRGRPRKEKRFHVAPVPPVAQLPPAPPPPPRANNQEAREYSSWHCAWCDTSRTARRREGPLGMQTLCDACGKRYARTLEKKLPLLEQVMPLRPGENRIRWHPFRPKCPNAAP